MIEPYRWDGVFLKLPGRYCIDERGFSSVLETHQSYLQFPREKLRLDPVYQTLKNRFLALIHNTIFNMKITKT